MRRVAIITLFFILSACTTQDVFPVTEIVRVYISATPQPTSTHTATPTPSPSSTPTQTPTPTAPPASISGNPRGFQQLDPSPAYGAPCGFVDTLDFPLDPPHGEDASGGFGFGSYNGRYEKYHAGEDWGFNNRSNFGQPVNSIGHGEITYAAPNGWGLDKGTVVIRHVFPWGGYSLSFYGHLDPPSVTLKTGDCVERGDKIGEIGNPRTPPHLHFEIRYHLPNSTGHGYWSTDPAKAGWLPPSQTIWETRLKASPGVLWTKPYTEGLTRGLGIYQDNYILIQAGEISAIDLADETILWSQPISETIRNAVLDVAVSQIYLLDLGGDLTAFQLPGLLETNWGANINASNAAELLPLPSGGVLVADRRRAIAVSTTGEILWQAETASQPTSWVQFGDQLIFVTSHSESPIWSADETGINSWDENRRGKLVSNNESIYLYTDDGIYELDVLNQTGTQIIHLNTINQRMSDLMPLQDGGLLLIHSDEYDRRLIRLNPAGTQVWERSIMAFPSGTWSLIKGNGADVYLLIAHSNSAGTLLDLYAVDLDDAELTHILNAGSRLTYTRNTWTQAAGDGMWLINVGGGPLAAFDPVIALDRITRP